MAGYLKSREVYFSMPNCVKIYQYYPKLYCRNQTAKDTRLNARKANLKIETVNLHFIFWLVIITQTKPTSSVITSLCNIPMKLVKVD